jgi:hypothetical protein
VSIATEKYHVILIHYTGMAISGTWSCALPFMFGFLKWLVKYADCSLIRLNFILNSALFCLAFKHITFENPRILKHHRSWGLKSNIDFREVKKTISWLTVPLALQRIVTTTTRSWSTCHLFSNWKLFTRFF